MSRLNNFIRNGAVTLGFFVITTLLSFFSRKIMLEYLGTDLLGLNTTLNSIIDFMVLMELGITSAIAVSLYKPLADGDKQKVNEIMWLMRYLYRILSIGIVAIALLVSPLLPFLVEKSNVTLPQTFIAYFVFVICSSVGYYFGYGRVLFRADQRNHIPTIISNVVLIAKVIVQILVVVATGSYWWWLGIELIFQVTSHYGIKIFLYRQYSDLEPKSTMRFKELFARYTDIFSNAKRIAVHSFAGFVLRQSDNIIIATMINLSSVAIYGNYAMINIAINGLIFNILNNSGAGVGNLVVTESKKRVYEVYKEYLSVNFYIVVVVNLAVLFLVEDFVRVWLGSQYVLPYNIVIAFVGVNILGGLTNASAAFNSAYKLFNDIAVPIIEAVLNIIVSIIGAYYWGLLGVIAGTFFSALISAVWKPIYFHRKGIGMSLTPFGFYVLKLLIVLSLSIVSIYYLAVCPLQLVIGRIDNMWAWLFYAAILFVGIAVIMGSAMYVADKNFRVFVNRLKINLV